MTSVERPMVVAPQATGVAPNMGDYELARSTFRWADARGALDGLPGGRGLNIAYEAVDRHVVHGRGEHVAIRWNGRRGEARDITYAQLAEDTNRFANLLGALGVTPGERVFVLCGRIPELHVAVLGTLKYGAVACPLFSVFGPEPVRQRMQIGDGRVLVTTEAIWRRKLASLRDDLPGLRHVVLVGSGGTATDVPGTIDLVTALASTSGDFAIPPTDPEQMALLHFTSGTTGTPKAAVHVHEAVVAHHATARFALDLHEDDTFWCTADPGWVTGTSYGIVAPLTHGVTSILDEGDFDAARWYSVLERHRVTVWYTAPTAIRMMMRAGADVARASDLSRLRFVASVGEPLNPEAVYWGLDALGLPIHDNWWQTETGGIMIANFAATPLRPGSMGLALPGIDATVLRRDADGDVVVRHGRVEELAPGEEGELALRPGWPSMFRGYLHEDERYRTCFAGGWYLTGDLVRRDADGYFWFVGRGDDVIKSAGHLIGPFEVESALMEHPAVAEAGVIGKPDPVAGAVVKAFVVLRAGYEPSDELRLDLVGAARKRLGAAVAPREIGFVEELPKTGSGKIMRRLLRARELGLPEGDLSTLERAP